MRTHSSPRRTTAGRAARPAPAQADFAYLELRRRIIDCEISPGSIVSEPMLTEQLGAQKAAIRTALAKLAHDGLLQAVPRQGYEVSPLTVEDALDLIEMRSITEPRAAYFAAGRIDGQVLKEAEALFRKGCDVASPASVTSFLHASREFKRHIALASGNGLLAQTVIQTSERFDRYLHLGFTALGLQASGSTEALQLVAALKAADAERSATAMRQILQRVGQSIVAELLTMELSESWRPAKSPGSRDAIVLEVLEPRLRHV